MKLILGLATTLALIACEEGSTTPATASLIEESGVVSSFTVTGTLSLDDIGDSVAASQELEVGQALEGATVFVQGFPDQPATTDATGAFALEIDVSTDETNLLASSYDVLMWYTIENDGDNAAARFGAKDAADPEEDGEEIDLGAIPLTFTMALHVFVENEAGDPLEECEVSVSGFGDQLLTIEKGNGQYDIDYLPAGTYNIVVVCTGHQVQTISFPVEQATQIDDWQTPDTVIMTEAIDFGEGH